MSLEQLKNVHKKLQKHEKESVRNVYGFDILSTWSQSQYAEALTGHMRSHHEVWAVNGMCNAWEWRAGGPRSATAGKGPGGDRTRAASVAAGSTAAAGSSASGST